MEKFDFIVIDACIATFDSKRGGEMICPVDVFTHPDVIESAGKLLAENGTFTLNTFALKGSPEEEQRIMEQRVKIYKDFRPHFDNCYYAQHSNVVGSLNISSA